MHICRSLVQTFPSGRRIHFEEFIRGELPVSHQLRIEMKGRMGQDQIVKLRCEAAMTLICSRFETFGYTVVESMMQGCPTVAFDVGPFAELIEHQVSGLLALSGDHDDLVRQVLRLLDHPDEAESFGAAARCHARQHYDAIAIASQTVAYYREVLALHGSKDSTAK